MDKKGLRTRMDYEDRIIIADMLNENKTLYAIATKLDRTTSTISREIRNRRICYDEVEKKSQNYTDADGRHTCSRLDRPPYVCNGCQDFSDCRYTRYVYDSKEAHRDYRRQLEGRRNGSNIPQDELKRINTLVSPMLKNGLSPYHIKQTLQGDVSVSESTLRRMIDRGDVDGPNRDLRNQKNRKKKLSKQDNPRKSKIGHTFNDYQAYITNNGCEGVEMDCVEGAEGDRKVLLTLHLTAYKLQLAFLLERKSSANVVAVLDIIEDTLGPDIFNNIFPAILTDNGPEFSDVVGLERSIQYGTRTRVFYCDPYRPEEKGRCENNHKYIRYIIPKGKSLEKYSQQDITLMVNHVNSLRRKSLSGMSPYEVAMKVLPSEFFSQLNLELIPPEQVILKPGLLSNSHRKNKSGSNATI